MEPVAASDHDLAEKELAYRLRVGASQPIPVPDTPPQRHCDVIMKGGITSGVVYPMAGVELAARYTLKSIGGTSAGAIAAGLFAAAEYRRSVGGSAKGFEDLREYPNKFGAKVAGRTSFLQALFLPAPGSRRLFRLLIAFLEKKKWLRPLRVLWVVISRYPLSLLGVAVGALLVILGNGSSNAWLRDAAVVLGVLAAAVGFIVTAAALVIRDAIRKLSMQKFGLCPGSGPPRPGHPKPLSDWIEESLDEIAFGGNRAAVRPPAYAPGDPLTFADLWRIQQAAQREEFAREARLRAINLEVMTTNLTQGRPYRLPVDANHLYFDPAELEDIFSPRLLDFLKRHARVPRFERGRRLHAIAEAKDLIPLPEPADLPVAVAIRLSLSFPLLISAVPLWGFDFTSESPDREGRRDEPTPTRCWFTDGGITSNFPIHFFDGPIPRWPTFGFNLTPFHGRFPHTEEDALNIWLPNTNGDGLSETWSSPKEQGALGRLSWFLSGVVATMQNWRDNLQLKVPGFRDRVAQIHLQANEGGLNLTMEETSIKALSKRGRIAAQILAERFGNQPPEHTVLTWNNHAWVRLRTTMSLLENHLARIEAAKAQKEGATSYGELVADPPSYPFTDRTNAAAMLAELAELSESWAGFGSLLGRDAPRPPSDLRVVPKV